ncbi:MAG TPA: hypothetical protein VN493_02075 [Thermoanaerobaculia bacterium]|nr:hypothetical protein [Thermoanaerobaculia bacterium]
MYKNINGCGTVFYGATDADENGSFITNKWFVLATFPLIPLRSFRVTYLGETEEKEKDKDITFGHYEILGDVPLAVGEAFKTYLLFLSLVGLSAGTLALGFSDYLGLFGSILSVIVAMALAFGLGPDYLYKAKLHKNSTWQKNYERLGLPVGLAMLLTLSILFVPKWLDPSKAERARKGRDLLMNEVETTYYNLGVDQYNGLLSKIEQADDSDELLAAYREFVEFSSKEPPFDSDVHPDAAERAKMDSNRFRFRTARLKALHFVGINSLDKSERIVCQGKAIELYQSVLSDFRKFADGEDVELRTEYRELEQDHDMVMAELVGAD